MPNGELDMIQVVGDVEGIESEKERILSCLKNK